VVSKSSTIISQLLKHRGVNAKVVGGIFVTAILQILGVTREFAQALDKNPKSIEVFLLAQHQPLRVEDGHDLAEFFVIISVEAVALAIGRSCFLKDFGNFL
jgi:hypothetical protein